MALSGVQLCVYLGQCVVLGGQNRREVHRPASCLVHCLRTGEAGDPSCFPIVAGTKFNYCLPTRLLTP